MDFSKKDKLYEQSLSYRVRHISNKIYLIGISKTFELNEAAVEILSYFENENSYNNVINILKDKYELSNHDIDDVNDTISFFIDKNILSEV